MLFVMQEGERVMETFQKQLHLPVTKIDDSKRMLSLLKVRLCHNFCILLSAWGSVPLLLLRLLPVHFCLADSVSLSVPLQPILCWLRCTQSPCYLSPKMLSCVT